MPPNIILDRRKGRPNGDGPYLKNVHGRGGRSGTIFITAGSSGHATNPRDLHGLNHPAMAVSLNVTGSLVLDIRGRQLDEVFLDDQGAVRDSFRLLK
jgi:hypothetical protein